MGRHAIPWEETDIEVGFKETAAMEDSGQGFIRLVAHPDEDWVDEPGETEHDPKPAVQHVNAEPQHLLVVIVVGSFSWTNKGAVDTALVDLWHQHDRRPIQLVTSGCPEGAEKFARDLGEGFGWTHAQLRDEDLGSIGAALVLGFITEGEGRAAELLAYLQVRFWTRYYRETTVRQIAPWSKR